MFVVNEIQQTQLMICAKKYFISCLVTVKIWRVSVFYGWAITENDG